MLIKDVFVQSNQKIAENTFLLKVNAEEYIPYVKPGQFFNIKVNNNSYPLLRRPFSISDVEGDSILFMYKVVGEGTRILANKVVGDQINILGPLGNQFSINESSNHVILIGGGIGIAPFPYLIKQLPNSVKYSVLFGVRTEKEVHSYGLKNILYSSDDGTVGIKGNTIELLDIHLKQIAEKDVKIFACGPNPMLKALQEYTNNKNIECEVSMESAMACGFGICQGCPIENKDNNYKLICKDGPVFNIRDIMI